MSKLTAAELARARAGPPEPLTPAQLAEAVALWQELVDARAAGVRLALITIRRDGFAVGYVGPRVDVR